MIYHSQDDNEEKMNIDTADTTVLTLHKDTQKKKSRYKSIRNVKLCVEEAIFSLD